MPDNDEQQQQQKDQQQAQDYIYRGEGGKEFKLPAEFKDEMNKRLNIERGKVKAEYDQKFQEIIADNEKTKAELMDLKKASMTDKERAEHEQKQKDEEFIKLQRERDDNWKLYSDTMTSKALYDSISKFDVWNPKQVEMLLRTIAVHDVDRSGAVTFTVEGKKLSSDDLVKSFLEDPVNANLIKSRMQPGGGTARGSAGGSYQGNTFTREQMRDPKIAAEYQKRLRSGENVSIVE